MKDKDFSGRNLNMNNDSLLNDKINCDNDSHIEKTIIKEVNENQRILDNVENKNKTYKFTNLSDLLYKLDYNTDIETIIDTLNNHMREQGKTNLFKKDDFNICLRKDKLDKFFKVKSVHEDFSLSLKYSLMDSKK